MSRTGKLITVEIEENVYGQLSDDQKEMLRVYPESSWHDGTKLVFRLADYRWDELIAEREKGA